MAFEDYKSKPSVVIVYTGQGKGKTTAGLGLLIRALGNRQKVAFLQFIKFWGVSEHIFLRDIQSLFKDSLFVYKGGMGFYKAGDLSPKFVTDEQHAQAAKKTFDKALKLSQSGEYDLVICDEINNAAHEDLVTELELKTLIVKKHPKTSLCLTGRDFPVSMLGLVDIATDMTKIKHHFDNKFLANKGIDY